MKEEEATQVAAVAAVVRRTAHGARRTAHGARLTELCRAVP